MNATTQYIAGLQHLQAGDLSLLRRHAGLALDVSLDGFDLFTGLWWPLRQQSQFAPRREVAWLVAKLYAAVPLPQQSGALLIRQLRRCQPGDSRARERFRRQVDGLLTASLRDIEPALRWALDRLAEGRLPLDWVALTDDLSRWEQEAIRLRWADHYLEETRKG